MELNNLLSRDDILGVKIKIDSDTYLHINNFDLPTPGVRAPFRANCTLITPSGNVEKSYNFTQLSTLISRVSESDLIPMSQEEWKSVSGFDDLEEDSIPARSKRVKEAIDPQNDKLYKVTYNYPGDALSDYQTSVLVRADSPEEAQEKTKQWIEGQYEYAYLSAYAPEYVGTLSQYKEKYPLSNSSILEDKEVGVMPTIDYELDILEKILNSLKGKNMERYATVQALIDIIESTQTPIGINYDNADSIITRIMNKKSVYPDSLNVSKRSARQSYTDDYEDDLDDDDLDDDDLDDDDNDEI